MSTQVYDILNSEVQRRQDTALVEQMNMLTAIYRGKLPAEYEKHMPKKGIRVVPNLIKNAWNDIVADVGKIPEIRATPLDETATEEKIASKLERIGTSYFDRAEPTKKRLFKSIAWWLMIGRAVAVVLPDHENKRPTISVRDPRTAMPKMRMVDNMPVELYDIIFKREITVEEAKALDLVPDWYTPKPTGFNKEATISVIELIDDTAYTIVSEAGVMQKEEHNLGICPAWVFQTYNPDEDGGLSLFEDQISMMVGVATLMSLKIAGADRAVNPIYFAKGHRGSVTLGPYVLNKLTQAGEMGVITPPAIPQVDRDIDQLVQFSNILNKNPEVRQGQIDSDGVYQSALTLDELASSVDRTIDDYWDLEGYGLKKILYISYLMDETLWPNTEKTLSFNKTAKKPRDKYIPSKDIAGRYDVDVDYGFGTGGYQGFLQNLQANQAKVRSRRAAIEAMPGVTDPDQEIRQIQLEDLDDAQMANIQSQAAQGQMDMVFLAEIKKEIAKGTRLDEAILKMAEKAQAQSQQAVETGATAPVTNPAPAQEAPPEEAPMPGLNPAGVI